MTFLHGFLGSGKEAPCGWRGITLPGHAFTPPLDEEVWFEPTLEWLKPQLDGGPLIGYSLGGRIALMAALRFPHLVSKALIISAHPGLEEGKEERLNRDRATAEKLVREGLPLFLESWYAQPLFKGLDLPPSIREIRLHHNPHNLAKALIGYSLGNQPSLWEGIMDAGERLHFIYGRDDLAYAPIAKRLQKISTVSILPGGHALHLQ